MTTPAPTPLQPKRGIVKQVLSGDSVIIRGLSGAPPPEKQINFSGITAPKLARRAGESETTKDEPWAWEAREFLRSKLIGEEVFFTSEKPPNAVREYGTLYYGKDFSSAENITESLVSEGLVTVRREGVRQTPELTRLIELEDQAKAAGEGKWGDAEPTEHVRDIKWSVDNMAAFVDKHKNKPIKAIIEHVRDGSTVRAFLLPDFYHITLLIAGIRCPGFKLDSSGKPDPNTKVEYADEARYYVEVRLLQREVEIVLESFNGNNFIGSIIHPKGNIAELLLKEGLAKYVDWMIKDEGKAKLKAAEKQAMDARKRLWKDVVPSTQKSSGKEDFTGVVLEVNNGDALLIKQLPSGEVRKISLASIRPPREVGRGNDDEGKPIARPKSFRPLYDIPYMFEAREYLRNKLIGKKVHVTIDYKQEARDGFPEKYCATVTLSGKNIAEALVQKGLATVVKYKVDENDRSSRYNDLYNAEQKAIKNQLGVHSRKEHTGLRVIEVDAARAKLELATFKRAGRIDAIVEFVASGSRLRLYVPKSNVLCTFLLGGISCPRAARQGTDIVGEPFGDEALRFTKEHCMQREVSIEVDTHDKVGNFIGWLFVDNVNMSVALVKEGLATVHFSSDKSHYGQALRQAEESAKSQRIGLWKDYVEEEKDDKKDEEKLPIEYETNYEEVVVTEITKEGSFYVQRVSEGPKAEALFAKLRQEFQANPPLPGAYNPRRGDLCAAKFTMDDEWYRAKVEKVQGSNSIVHYIDYGNKETIPNVRLASLPAAYIGEKPFATEYVLPFVTLPKDEEYAALAIKYLKEDTSVGKLYLNVQYKNQGGPPAASLHLEKTSESDIVKNLVRDGLLIVDFKGRRQNKALQSYREAQDIAKKEHSNIWEYGDITEDDAKEFGLGK